MTKSRNKIAFVASEAPEARKAHAELSERYGDVPMHDAEVIVALGGDGLMLQTLHAVLENGAAIYGMNRGSVGFLMNEYDEDNLAERLRAAETTTIRPLRKRVC